MGHQGKFPSIPHFPRFIMAASLEIGPQADAPAELKQRLEAVGRVFEVEFQC